MKTLSTLCANLSAFAYVLIFTALFSSCRAKKEIAVSEETRIDSIAATQFYGYAFRIDSAIGRINLVFDTLDIAIERQVAADTTARMRIRAVKGSVIADRRQTANDIREYNRLDSVAYKRASATSTAEHSATASIAEPPDTTLVFAVIGGLAVIVSAVLVYLKRRRT